MDCTMHSYESKEVFTTKITDSPKDKYCRLRFSNEHDSSVSIMFSTKPHSLIAYHQLRYAVEELGKHLYGEKEY